MSKLSLEQLINLKLLLSVEGIGPVKLRNLLSRFKTVENILDIKYNSLVKHGVNSNLAQRIIRVRELKPSFKKTLEEELTILEKLGSKLITVWDKEYPSLLKKIYDPPIILYYRGEFKEQDNYSIAIVGTRLPTNYGKQQAERFSQEIVKQNITIVSGLARGIDSVAHRTALKYSGRTIAVLGCGIDVIYPPENKKLFEEIACKGLIISEYPPGTKPDAMNFPKRNRIISGLSLGTIVIETSETGGAIQTASFALDQNREVFAVPGNLGIKQSEGTNKIIKENKAKLITSIEDVMEELQIKLKPIVGKNIPKPQIDLNIFEEKLFSSLTNEPMHIDVISLKTSLSTSDCLVHLLSLEFRGLIKQLPGKMFVLD